MTKEQRKEYNKLYYLKNKDKFLHTEKRALYQKAYRKINKVRIAKRYSDYLKVNDQARISQYLRNKLIRIIKSSASDKMSIILTGLDKQAFCNYIQSKFKDGMSWDNHGLWNIDHIVPCDQFDLTLKTNQKLCFNYTNLQPLWAKENLTKGKKLLTKTVVTDD